jgi:DNA polymerase-3 subunit alpha
MTKEDAYAQEIMLCIQTQHTMHEQRRPLSMIDVPDFYFKTEVEMRAAFADLPEAIENTVKIADMCNVEIPHGKMILPRYPIPTDQTPEDYLKTLVYNNKQRVKGFSDEVVMKRIDYELDIINQKGYANYFLFTADFVTWAKDNGIAVGPGRGSAAGSIVSYCLRITDVNPLEYDLPFERFLNPGRPSPPDIDIDFADRRRDEVLQYVRKKIRGRSCRTNYYVWDNGVAHGGAGCGASSWHVLLTSRPYCKNDSTAQTGFSPQAEAGDRGD